MVIRLMTVATVLMLIACLMIGASIALAWPVRAAESADADPAIRQDTVVSPASVILPQQADPDSVKRPYRETLAADESAETYDFDGLPAAPKRDRDEPLPFAALGDC